MPYVRVQQRLRMLGAPGFGQWNTYSSAWFQTSTLTPDSTVYGLLERLFWGAPATGTSTWHSAAPIVTSPSSGLLTTWEWSGTALVKLADHAFTPVNWTTPGAGITHLPPQVALAIGYRATLAGHPVGPHGKPSTAQRSRFWVGPLSMGPATLLQPVGTTLPGLPGLAFHLQQSAVDEITTNTKAVVNALAAHTPSWQLVNRSGKHAETNFHLSDEIYVDDALDTMRSRRTFTSYQKRLTI